METKKNSKAMTMGIAAVALAVIANMPLAVASVFNPHIAEHMGASMTSVALFASISALAGMITSFLLGGIMKKFPAKGLIVVGGLFVGALMIAIGVADSLVIIYIAAFLQGIGLIVAGTAMAQTIISKWFIKNRGMMMSLILVGTMLVAAVMNIILPGLISANGYKPVALVIGIVSAVIMVALGLFVIVDDPEKVGQKPLGFDDVQQGEGKKDTGSVVNFTLKQALVTAPFWCVMIYKILTTIAAQAISNQAFSYYQSIGLNDGTAGLVIALNSLFGMVVCIVAGILADKKSPTFAAVVTAGLGAVAFLGAFIWSGVVCAIIASALFAGILGCSLYGSTMIVKLFGTKEAGGLLGFVNAAGNIGSFIGPILAASFFDAFGNYTLGFEFIGVLLIVAIALALWAGTEKSAAKLKSIEAAGQTE